MFDNNPSDHFIALVDINNHRKEDNLRSAKMIEKANTMKNLLHGLRFMNEMDRGRIKRDEFLENWGDNIVGDARFKTKRLNEIFNLFTSRTINDEMNPEQIRCRANVLLKPFGLVIRSMSGGKYALKELFDIQGLIERKNSRGVNSSWIERTS